MKGFSAILLSIQNADQEHPALLKRTSVSLVFSDGSAVQPLSPAETRAWAQSKGIDRPADMGGPFTSEKEVQEANAGTFEIVTKGKDPKGIELVFRLPDKVPSGGVTLRYSIETGTGEAIQLENTLPALIVRR